MKKMLIIEEPESCETCPLRSYSNLMLMCTPMREAASDVRCPLRPLPQKKGKYGEPHEYDTDIHYEIGWNECLAKITGETEMKEIFVYRHKTDKGVYLKRDYNCCGGSIASHFYSATKNFKDALQNSLNAYDEPFKFECHLNTPYSFGEPVDDTVTVIDTKEFEFDGYKGTALKEIKYHLKDFEKVVFVEKQNESNIGN